MNAIPARALVVARPVLLGLSVLNLLYAASIGTLLVASFFIADWPWKPLGYDLATMHPQVPAGLRAIMVIGLLGAASVHAILRNLREIVASVRQGDAFVLRNAQRLGLIAWCVLAIEVMRLAVMAISGALSIQGEMGGYSLAPWLAVLLLFVLAGVFAQGARMRTDLEGTV